MSKKNALKSLSNEELNAVQGGGGKLKVAKKLGKFALKKAGPIGWAVTAYDGVQGYRSARKEGKSVGKSVLNGAKNAVW